MMGGGGVAELRDTGTHLGGVSGDNDAGVASFLQEAAEELRGVAEVVEDAGPAVPVEATAAVLTTGVASELLGVAVQDISVAEGMKGLASTLRADPAMAAEGYVSAEVKGDGLVDTVGGRSEVLLKGLKSEAACEAGTVVSTGVDFVREAGASEAVLVMGVVVWESGVEPGGVWRTESRKEKVWETGLRLSPVISARLPLTSPAKLFLVTVLAAVLIWFSGLADILSSMGFCPFLTDTEKSSKHIGS